MTTPNDFGSVRPDRVWPDYQGGGIVNLMASLVAGLGGADTGYPHSTELAAEEIAAYRQVLLILVDGLGRRFLNRHPGSSLAEHCRGRMTSVLPSTTASAVTTFLTGLAPQQHGVTGWHMYFRELGSVLSVLPGTPRYGGVPLKAAGICAHRLFGHVPVFDLIPAASVALTPRRIAQSDFNLSHRGKAEMRPFDTLDDFFAEIAAMLRSGQERKFVYAYWSDFDRISHESGAYSPEADWHYTRIDQAFQRLLRQMAGRGVLVIVTADHGFIDTGPRRTIDLAQHPELKDCLILPLCGEPRMAYCYVRPDRREDFEAYVRGNLAHCAELWSSRELIERGGFGLGTPHPRLAERVGDYTLLMKENYVIRDWLPWEEHHEHIGVHGGCSEEEMYVPLIVTAR